MLSNVTAEIARNEARQAIVERALIHLAERGPANVHPKDICEELGLSKALVNYHFGGRDGLITEAMVVGYERYVDHLWTAAQAAGPAPEARLFAWIDAQVDWTAANAGLAAALNFPQLASGMPTEILEPWTKRIGEAGARNFSNLQTLVRAARAATTGREPSAASSGLDAAFVGWVTLGMSVWNAGNHLPTQHLEARGYFEAARQHVHTQVRALLARTPSN